MKKRKTAAILMASVMMLALMGCGSTDNGVTTETATEGTSVATSVTDKEEKKVDTASESSSKPEVKQEAKKEKTEVSAADASFEYNGQTVSILDDVQTTLGTLGTPTQEKPSPFSNNGEDVSYVYGSDPNTIEYMSLKVEGDELVPDSFIIYDKNVKTSKSVGIGSTEAEIKAAYGDPDNVSKDASSYELAYDFGNFALGFDFDKKKKVNAIIYSNMDTFNKYVGSGNG